MVIDHDGDVGIGTREPTELLHLEGIAGTDGIKFPDGTLQTTAYPKTEIRTITSAAFHRFDSGTTEKYREPNTGTYLLSTSSPISAELNLPHGATITKITWYYLDNHGQRGFFFRFDVGDKELMTLTKSNNTAEIDGKLKINSTARIANGLGIRINADSTQASLLVKTPSGLSNAHAVKIIGDNNNLAVVRKALLKVDGSGHEGAFSISQTSSITGIDVDFTSTDGGSDNAIKKTALFRGGNVGVNTGDPTKDLHIAGEVRIEDGTQQEGYVLTSDTDGNASWQRVGVPVGTIQMWPTATAPDGWMICDGATFSASTYPDLNIVLGGNTLPDFNGRFPLGSGNSNTTSSVNHLLEDTGGAEGIALQLDEIPAHSHNVTIGFREGEENGSGNDYSDLNDSGMSNTYTSSDTGGNAQGNTNPHSNMPPFYTINFIIRAE